MQRPPLVAKELFLPFDEQDAGRLGQARQAKGENPSREACAQNDDIVV